MIVPINLKKKSKVLIAGCGGGFDVIAAGFPIGLELERRGHDVIYSSFSFTSLPNVENAEKVVIGPSPVDFYLQVDCNSSLDDDTYFPEKYMCQWYQQHRSEEKYIYCYSGQGVESLRKLFNHLQDIEKIDCLFIVDGGADGIMRGDEYDLATPEIDAISIIAGAKSEIPESYYVLSAFGTEGVGNRFSHAEALERMSDLIQEDKMYGVTSILNNSLIKGQYISLYNFINSKIDRDPSIIMGSIAESLKGTFSFSKYNSRIKWSPVWVSALTSLLWFFDLKAVAEMKTYYKDIEMSNHFFEVLSYFRKAGLTGFKKKESKERPGIPI